VFMSEHLEKAGCGFSRRHFKCVPCDKSRIGGFSPHDGVSKVVSLHVKINDMNDPLDIALSEQSSKQATARRHDGSRDDSRLRPLQVQGRLEES
jgi:hypothetical protein